MDNGGTFVESEPDVARTQGLRLAVRLCFRVKVETRMFEQEVVGSATTNDFFSCPWKGGRREKKMGEEMPDTYHY